jgi:hypothetical protein
VSHPTVTAGVRGRTGRLEPLVVSALFDSPDAVDEALRRLHDAGVPRDLVEVVVSREAAERYYRGGAQPPGRETFRFAAIGALSGLLITATLSLVIVAMPGWEPPRATAIVQLLGPNIGAIGGAALGALFGFFRRRRPSRRHARAAEATGSIVLVVRTRAESDITTVERILSESGGREVRVEE